VLWALPAATRSALPGHLQVSSPSWRLEAFVPQAAVLAHPAVRCFVSHCGQNSVQEALGAAVPLVCLPFYCDQYEWAASVCKHRRAGVRLDKVKSDEGQIRAAVNQVLGDDAIQRHADTCRDDMLQSRESASRLIPGGIRDDECVGVPLAAALIAGTVEPAAVRASQSASRRREGARPAACGCAVQ